MVHVMLNNKYSYIPKELLDVGYSLDSMGISEIAWKSQDALKIIEFLGNKGYPILGGDVYTLDKEKIESTYDSWYMNKSTTEDFVETSIKKAFEYIENYSISNGDKFIYSIIFELE